MATTQSARVIPTSEGFNADTQERIRVLEEQLAKAEDYSSQIGEELLQAEEQYRLLEIKYDELLEDYDKLQEEFDSAKTTKKRKKSSNAKTSDPIEKYHLLGLRYNKRTEQFFRLGQRYVIQLWKGNALTWGIAQVAKGNVIVDPGDDAKTVPDEYGLQIIGYFIEDKHHGKFEFTYSYKKNGQTRSSTRKYSIRPAPKQFSVKKNKDGTEEPIIYGVPNQLITAGGPVHTMLMFVSNMYVDAAKKKTDDRLKNYQGKALSRSGWGHIMAIGKESEKVEFLDKPYFYIASNGKKYKDLEYSYANPTLKHIKNLYLDDDNRTKTSATLKKAFAAMFKDEVDKPKRKRGDQSDDEVEDERTVKRAKLNNGTVHHTVHRAANPTTHKKEPQYRAPSPTPSPHKKGTESNTNARRPAGKSPATMQQYKEANFDNVDHIPETQYDEDEDNADRDEVSNEEDSDDEYEKEDNENVNAIRQAQDLLN